MLTLINNIFILPQQQLFATIQALTIIAKVYAKKTRNEAEEEICRHRSIDTLPPRRWGRSIPSELLDALEETNEARKLKKWIRFTLKFLRKPATKQQLLIDVTAWRIVRRRKKALISACQQYMRDMRQWPRFAVATNALIRVRRPLID